ncbi:hypothetical protein BD311DRAFT_802551 [Dichomitus squalens]|uniref:Transmembrane protein n=1 Tax=Dichomitus squalens TaxID=114155 RepID=A0A4Q9N135_9APHY|nr:hypothetical protein BD311DRAFT_802551 [Dichomitus squalens]
MSSQDSASVVALYNSVFVGNCCGIGGAVFLVYAYIISMGEGVNLFLTSKLTGASILFYANLVFPFVTNAMALIGFVRMSDKVQYGFGLTGVNDPTFGCATGVNLPVELTKQRAFTIVSRTCLISADALVLAITWYAIPRRSYSNFGGESSTFAEILVRNGTIYFGSLLILNALHLMFTLLSIDLAFEPVSYMTMFTEPVTAVLVSRFLLDLQAANRKALDLDPQDMSHIGSSQGPTGSLIFERVVGSLGSMILPGELVELATDDETTADPLDAENTVEKSSGTDVEIMASP